MKNALRILLIPVLLLVFDAPKTATAGGLEITPAADVVSRYIWRGLMINDAPNIQPSVTMSVAGFEAGLWGSSTLAKTNRNESDYSFSHEIDLWFSYTLELGSGMALSMMLTDYYFPNGGIRIGNFHNYDATKGPGAHTIETGVAFTLPESFPMTFSSFINIYNDEGYNTYFQIDFPLELKDVSLDFFLGATLGSEDNPGYYGSKNPNIINMGFNVSKTIKFTENFELPTFVGYVLNPRFEVSYLIFGVSF